MKCPNCGKELAAVDCNGFEIHECAGCNGRWFDRGQLRKAKDSEDDYLRWVDFDPFGKDAEGLSVVSDGKECPGCSRKMMTLTYSKSGVLIDKCPDCQGVWIDSGEFEKIIKYLESVIHSETARDYTIDSFKQFVEILTGPKGAGSETKDFLAVLNLLEMRIAAEHPKLTETLQSIYKNIPFK